MDTTDKTNLKNLELLHTQNKNKDFYLIPVEEMMELVKFLNKKNVVDTFFEYINFFEYKFVEELKSNQDYLKPLAEYFVKISAMPIDPIFQQLFMAEDDWCKMCINCDNPNVLNEQIRWNKVRWQSSDKAIQLKSVENMIYLVYETTAQILKQKPELFANNLKKLSTRKHVLDPRILSNFCFEAGIAVNQINNNLFKSPAQLLGIKNQFDTDRNNFLDEVRIHLEKKWLDLETKNSISTAKIKVL